MSACAPAPSGGTRTEAAACKRPTPDERRQAAKFAPTMHDRRGPEGACGGARASTSVLSGKPGDADVLVREVLA